MIELTFHHDDKVTIWIHKCPEDVEVTVQNGPHNRLKTAKIGTVEIILMK